MASLLKTAFDVSTAPARLAARSVKKQISFVQNSVSEARRFAEDLQQAAVEAEEMAASLASEAEMQLNTLPSDLSSDQREKLANDALLNAERLFALGMVEAIKGISLALSIDANRLLPGGRNKAVIEGEVAKPAKRRLAGKS